MAVKKWRGDAATSPRPEVSARDTQIISDYERGAKYAAVLLCAMFAFLSFGCVMLGW